MANRFEKRYYEIFGLISRLEADMTASKELNLTDHHYLAYEVGNLAAAMRYDTNPEETAERICEQWPID